MKTGTGRDISKKTESPDESGVSKFSSQVSEEIRETNEHEGGLEFFVVLLGSRHCMSHSSHPF